MVGVSGGDALCSVLVFVAVHNTDLGVFPAPTV